MNHTSHKSTCSYCGVGCGLIVKKDAQGKVSVTGDDEHPVNKGMLCSKGRNLHHVVQDTSDRILYPEMRWNKYEDRTRVSWDDALTRTAAVFQSTIEKYGPDSVGFYVSGQCTTEEYYLVNKLTKGFIGTNNIDTNSRLCMSSAVVGYKKTVGDDLVPICYDDIELADCFLIAGANPAWCHPILFRRIEQHKEKNPDVNIIVIDPRKTQTCSIANMHLQIKPGTDTVLYNAICKRIIENGDADLDFINKHTTGFKTVSQNLDRVSIDEAARICGVSVKEIRLAAYHIGKSKAFISMWAMGLNQSSHGVDKNLALLNISLITGQIGKPGSGPFSLTGQPNAMGGREVGGMANLLAAHKNLSDPDDRAEVAKFWGGGDISPKRGYTATEMIEALESGDLKVIWIICTNPLVSLPDARRVEKALKKAKLVIVQDISHRSDTTQYADVLLPAAGWLEKEGTMTNSERRVSYLPKVVDAPGEALPDAEIIWTFAQKMGYQSFYYDSVSEVFDEHCRLTKYTPIDISGLNYHRLKTEGTFQWPVPYHDHPGTERLFEDHQFQTSNGKAYLNVASGIAVRSEKISEEFPLILTTGRIRDQWHTMTRTGKVNGLLSHINEPYIEISAVDARNRGITQGDIVVIESTRGQVRLKAIISEGCRAGMVFIPMHWGKNRIGDLSRANNLTKMLIDPVSLQPDFKYSAVEVRRFRKKKEKICIIGAGAAAFQFIKSYRQRNDEDDIHVFSGEPYPFYNRILLPDYIIEELSWEQLQKIKEEEIKKLGIVVHPQSIIEKINSEKKHITTHTGEAHGYDQLILAMGSRPFVPRDVPLKLPGVFTMRSREDADRFRSYLSENTRSLSEQHVVIVGGGLLGIELAGSLRSTGVKITIVNRGSRLMERQLDGIGSRILAEDITERGITLYQDNEVETITEAGDHMYSVLLKSGKKLNADAVLFAIGTIPNIEVAETAGIQVRRGVVVDDYLRTSDDSIYAIGELAEWNQQLFGITYAAEQQADVLAYYMLGYQGAPYSGTVSMNVLKIEELDLCSIGRISYPSGDSNYEEIIFQDLAHRYYKRCIIYKDRMVGAILIGDKSEFGEFKRLIETQLELSHRRKEVLRGVSKKEPQIGRLICSCNSVGTGNIENAIAQGCCTVYEIGEKTDAGTACGSCKPEIQALLKENGSKRKKKAIAPSANKKLSLVERIFQLKR